LESIIQKLSGVELDAPVSVAFQPESHVLIRFSPSDAYVCLADGCYVIPTALQMELGQCWWLSAGVTLFSSPACVQCACYWCREDIPARGRSSARVLLLGSYRQSIIALLCSAKLSAWCVFCCGIIRPLLCVSPPLSPLLSDSLQEH